MPKTHIDITGVLAPEMYTYKPLVPDVPPFEHRQWATIEDRGWENDWFAMPTLAGTYLETGKHLDSTVMSIEQVPPERFFLDAIVAHIPKGPREHITATELESAAPTLSNGDALIVATGWEQHWNDSSGKTFVMQSPHFELEAMQWLTGRGASILGGDMPCFDDPVAEKAQAVNDVLFGSGAMILAPLVNLEKCTQARYRLTVMPIPLAGSCGAPCRAILTTIEE